MSRTIDAWVPVNASGFLPLLLVTAPSHKEGSLFSLPFSLLFLGRHFNITTYAFFLMAWSLLLAYETSETDPASVTSVRDVASIGSGSESCVVVSSRLVSLSIFITGGWGAAFGGGFGVSVFVLPIHGVSKIIDFQAWLSEDSGHKPKFSPRIGRRVSVLIFRGELPVDKALCRRCVKWILRVIHHGGYGTTFDGFSCLIRLMNCKLSSRPNIIIVQVKDRSCFIALWTRTSTRSRPNGSNARSWSSAWLECRIFGF